MLFIWFPYVWLCVTEHWLASITPLYGQAEWAGGWGATGMNGDKHIPFLKCCGAWEKVTPDLCVTLVHCVVNNLPPHPTLLS